MDGRVVGGRVSDRDESTPLVKRYLYLTNGGRVGTKFSEPLQHEHTLKLLQDRDTLEQLRKTMGEEKWRYLMERIEQSKFLFHPAFQQTYEVTQRDEGSDTILIRLGFIGTEVHN